MVQLTQPVTATENEFSNPPDGSYNVEIESEELKEDKNGDQYIALRLNIIDGEYVGRKIFHNLALWSAGKRGEIANDQLSNIAYYCGVNQVTDTAQLLGKPFQVKTRTKDSYYNVVGIGACETATTPAQAANAAPPMQQPQHSQTPPASSPVPPSAAPNAPGIMNQ